MTPPPPCSPPNVTKPTAARRRVPIPTAVRRSPPDVPSELFPPSSSGATTRTGAPGERPKVRKGVRFRGHRGSRGVRPTRSRSDWRRKRRRSAPDVCARRGGGAAPRVCRRGCRRCRVGGCGGGEPAPVARRAPAPRDPACVVVVVVVVVEAAAAGCGSERQPGEAVAQSAEPSSSSARRRWSRGYRRPSRVRLRSVKVPLLRLRRLRGVRPRRGRRGRVRVRERGRRGRGGVEEGEDVGFRVSLRRGGGSGCRSGCGCGCRSGRAGRGRRADTTGGVDGSRGRRVKVEVKEGRFARLCGGGGWYGGGGSSACGVDCGRAGRFARRGAAAAEEVEGRGAVRWGAVLTRPGGGGRSVFSLWRRIGVSREREEGGSCAPFRD